MLLIHDLLPSNKEQWSQKQKNFYSNTKSIVVGDLWKDCKLVRNHALLFKAAKQVAQHKYPTKSDEFHEKWARKWKWFILHLVNEKRNYAVTRLARLYIDELENGNGKAPPKKSEGDDDDDDEEEDGDGGAKVVDLSNPVRLKYRPDLPTPELVEKLVLRDMEAWGFNEVGLKKITNLVLQYLP